MSQTGYHVAKILARRVASPTVVVLELQVLGSSFRFQPGQWVDFRVPPHDWIGGFSPASVPSDLPKITLAVKRSDHAPSQWVHSASSSEIGREIHIQVGGTCVLDTATIDQQSVVFCAGGIGISPLLSMYRYWNELQRQYYCKNRQEQDGSCPVLEGAPTVSFLYSVPTEEELVFGDVLVHEASVTNNNHDIPPPQITFTLTQQPAWTDSLKSSLEARGVVCRTGRLMKEFLQQADPTSTFYLCGPPAMLDEGIDLLERWGIDKDHVHFEKWW